MGINIAIDMTKDGGCPSLSLSQKTIKMLANMRFYLDVDMHIHDELPEYARLALSKYPNDHE